MVERRGLFSSIWGPGPRPCNPVYTMKTTPWSGIVLKQGNNVIFSVKYENSWYDSK